ncbi:hypothetical protein HanRHA438_Chr07g0309991 [Helianthus annuus]|nr:hypothetical protein HanRHA438_Chr07g0309991 [Helianthus annuus]
MASTGKYSLIYILLLIFHFSYIKSSTYPQDSPSNFTHLNPPNTTLTYFI